MPHGGRRNGAGRKNGSLTAKTRAIAEQASAEGITPLEVMIKNMRHHWAAACDDANAEKELARAKAQEAAKDAAPYIHARLANTTVGSDPNRPVLLDISDNRRPVFDFLSDFSAIDGVSRETEH